MPEKTKKYKKIQIFFLPIKDFVTWIFLWHQSNKQPVFFTSLSQFEQLKKITNFYWSRTNFLSVLDPWKVRFLFQLLNWKQFVKKNWENKIIGLVVQCHKLITVESRILKTDQMDELDLHDLLYGRWTGSVTKKSRITTEFYSIQFIKLTDNCRKKKRVN